MNRTMPFVLRGDSKALPDYGLIEPILECMVVARGGAWPDGRTTRQQPRLKAYMLRLVQQHICIEDSSASMALRSLAGMIGGIGGRQRR